MVPSRLYQGGKDLIMNLLNSMQPAEVADGELKPSHFNMLQNVLDYNILSLFSASLNGKSPPPAYRYSENNGIVSSF